MVPQRFFWSRPCGGGGISETVVRHVSPTRNPPPFRLLVCACSLQIPTFVVVSPEGLTLAGPDREARLLVDTNDFPWADLATVRTAVSV